MNITETLSPRPRWDAGNWIRDNVTRQKLAWIIIRTERERETRLGPVSDRRERANGQIAFEFSWNWERWIVREMKWNKKKKNWNNWEVNDFRHPSRKRKDESYLNFINFKNYLVEIKRGTVKNYINFSIVIVIAIWSNKILFVK